MRTLTLGVLIVSGGTLAALPFRRYHAIPDSSTAPVHATGPTDSALELGPYNSVSAPVFAPPQMAEAILPGSILATHTAKSGPGSVQRPPSSHDTHAAKHKPSHGGPLTYEDLVLPIEMPEIVKQRFNATAAVKSIQMQEERFADTKQARMEPMTASTADDAPPLFASEPQNEIVSRSVLQRGENESASKQASGNQHPRLLANSSRPSNATDVVNVAKRETSLDSGSTRSNEGVEDRGPTAGSLASSTAARNPSEKPSAVTHRTDSGILPVTENNSSTARKTSPSRVRHWIRQPD